MLGELDDQVGKNVLSVLRVNREAGRSVSLRRCSIASLICSIAIPVFFSIEGRRFCLRSSR